MRPGSRIPNGQEPSPVPAPPGQQAKDRPGPSDPHHPSRYREREYDHVINDPNTPVPQARPCRIPRRQWGAVAAAGPAANRHRLARQAGCRQEQPL